MERTSVRLWASKTRFLIADHVSDTDNIRWRDVLRIENGSVIGSHSETFSGPSHIVHAIHVGSVNLEGVDLRLVTTSGEYTVAIHPSGTRMIEFASPLNVTSATLSAGGTDEEATPGSDDIRMSVGYTSCPRSGASGNTTCPTDGTYRVTFRPGIAIPDGTDSQDASGTVTVPENVTTNTLSVSVNITHSNIGDLKVILTSPDGTEAVLHNRTGGDADDLVLTYNSSSHSALQTLINSTALGTWTLSVGDYAAGNAGTFNDWNLVIDYSEPEPEPPVPPVPEPPTSVTLFSDDFEASTLTANWQATGDTEWEPDGSLPHGVPVVPNHTSTNTVLHADNCDDPCILTMRNSVNLTDGYSSASLSFWRFVDSGLDRDEHLKVEAYDGSEWITIYHWSERIGGNDNEWHLETYDLRPYLPVADFKIRITMQASSSSEDVQLDDVMITAIPGTPPPPRAILFTEDFESESFDGWLAAGYDGWEINYAESHGILTIPGHQLHNYVMAADRCNPPCILTMYDTLDLTAYSSANLTFWRFVSSNLDDDEYLKVEAYDGSAWSTIYHWSHNLGGDDSTWHQESYDLSAYLNSTYFKIRFTRFSPKFGRPLHPAVW